METSPILSIIVPTKDNAVVAYQTINALAGLELENTEIIVHDNSKTDDLKLKLGNLIKSNRVIYKHSDKLMSIIGNFNLSLETAQGKYICFIGDDDAVHPMITKVAHWADKNQIEAVVSKLKAIYYWPQSYSTQCRGRLLIERFTGEFTKHNCQEQLVKLLNNGCLDYINYYLPKVYHGIVLREKVNQIKQICGAYFGGLVPDIYGVTALSLIIEEVTYIDFPLTISGISPKSNSGKAVKNLTNGRLEDAPQFVGRGEYVWSNNIPRVFSDETIWADSLMHALDDMKRSDLKFDFDSSKLYQRIWERYENLRNDIADEYMSLPKPKQSILSKLSRRLKQQILSIPFFVKIISKLKGKSFVLELENINEAISYIIQNSNIDLNLNE